MVRRAKLWLVCIGFSVMGVSSLWAQQVARDTITGKVHQIGEVKVSTKRMPKQVAAPIPTQVMTKAEINDLGLQNMADAVRRFAGTNVRDYGGIGGLKTVSVRNLGAAHTAVSYDGVVVSNCQAGQIDIGRFSLDNVSTLSLAIGQSDNLLQSARAYASAGILNIETEKPEFSAGRNYTFRGQLKGGSFGLINPSVRWGQKLGEQTSVLLNGNFLRADGIYPFTLVNGKHVTKERRNNSDINTWHGEANIYHTFQDNSELNVKAYYFNSERGLPGSVTLYNPQANERLWDENFFAQASYKKKISNRWNYIVQGKYNHAYNKYEDTDVKYEGGKQTDINRQDEYYLSATALYRPIDGLDISLAQDGILNKLKSNLDDCPFPTRYSLLTALNVRYRWNFLTATASLVNTFITERVESGDRPDDRRHLSPSVAVNLRPWKEQQLFFRLMYKNTFRVPTFNDLYYLRIGNRGLRPEKAREYNVGITWNGKPLRFMDYLTLTVDGYYNEVTDKIIAFPSTYVWKMANYGKVHITGMDATVATAFALFRRMNLRVTAGYTWQKAIDLTNPEAKNYKNQLPYTPEHSGNVALLLATPWVNIGYTLVGVSKRYYMSQNIPVNQIDGYVEHSATFSHDFKFKKYKLRLQAELVNFTDEQYDVIKYYPMPGRSWNLTGTINF